LHTAFLALVNPDAAELFSDYDDVLKKVRMTEPTETQAYNVEAVLQQPGPATNAICLVW